MFSKIMIEKFLPHFEDWLRGSIGTSLDTLSDSEIRDIFIAKSIINFF
jgi:hypothetical protein